MRKYLLVVALTCLASLSWAGDMDLPTPVKTGGMPLQEAIASRRTVREYAATPISPQDTSNLLWAAIGISDPSGKRTTPTARNKQELSLYVLLANGSYLYDAVQNKLIQITTEDLRPFVHAEAPLHIVIVGDTDKNPEKYCQVDAGFVGQNIYLFCTGNKMGSCFRGSIEADKLHSGLKLSDNLQVLYAQTVGYLK